jgi:hypothetical protein
MMQVYNHMPPQCQQRPGLLPCPVPQLDAGRRRSAFCAVQRRRASAALRAVCASAAQDGRLDAQVAVVLGTQWGDEGKGKLVDILAQQYDIVARAQVCMCTSPYITSICTWWKGTCSIMFPWEWMYPDGHQIFLDILYWKYGSMFLQQVAHNGVVPT